MTNFDQFVHKCHLCGGQLYVGRMTVNCAIPIHPDGWCDSDSKVWDTEDEEVFCMDCSYSGPLVMIDSETGKETTAT